jgi:hypothetical protein
VRLAGRLAQFARAVGPVVALADLVALHCLPQRIGVRRDRPQPAQAARGQAELGFGVAMALEHGYGDHAAEVQ